MPRPVINGTLLPVPQAPEMTFDPTKGIWYRLTWESAGDGLGAIAAQCQAARVGYDWLKSGHKSRIAAQASGAQLGWPDVLTDNWQILANEIQFGIWQSPFVQANLGTSGEAACAMLAADAIAG